MRKKIVAGNWKMNKTLQEGVEYAKELKEALKGKSVNCEVVIGAPATHLYSLAKEADGVFDIASENSADKASGAYTGETSAEMVKSTGAKYAILGHSERRQYYVETDAKLKDKVKLALDNELIPIFCIGETKEEREANNHFKVVDSQMEKALFELKPEDFAKIVIAYEPVWAIGTGLTATSEQAQEIHSHIRKSIEKKYGKEIANNTTILYGGSCNGSNAKELFSCEDIDGGLIGGASLEVSKFMPIIEAF